MLHRLVANFHEFVTNRHEHKLYEHTNLEAIYCSTP